MPTISYDVHVDTLKDGAFGGSIDSLNDLVRAINWQQGMDEPRGQVARPSSAQIVLNNVNAGSPCAPFDHEYAGSEELSNGDFSTWAAGLPTGWTLFGVTAPNSYVTEVEPNALYGGSGTGALNAYRVSGALVRIRQIGVLVVGRTYRAKMTISAIGSGGVQLSNPSGQISPLYQTTGIKEWVFTAASTNFELYVPTGVVSDVTIDSVSVVEVCKYYAVAEGTLVRISSTDAYGVGTPLARTQFWVGRIARPVRTFAPQTGAIEGQSVTLECEDPTAEFFKGEFTPRLLRNTTVDAVIADVLDSGEALFPYRKSGWLLGVEGASSLGISTRLAPTGGYRALDAGDTTIEWCGDASERGAGVSIASYLQDVLASEAGGRLFWDGRTSQVTFHKRNRDLTTTALVTVDSSHYSSTELRYGDPVYNAVTIYYTERQVGAAGAVVWSADTLPIRLNAGAVREISARYRLADDDTATIAVVDEINPLLGVDYSANSAEDGTGTDASAQVTVTVDWRANNAKIRLSNGSPDPIYLQTLQLRATPLIARPGQITRTNGDSIFAYGLRPAEPINLVNVATVDFAESVASYLLGIYKQPRQMVRQVAFEATRDSDTVNWLFSCGIGTRIRLQDSGLNHDEDYIIVGESHSVEAMSKVHYTTWTLKPMNRERYFILDQSRLGDDTRLGF